MRLTSLTLSDFKSIGATPITIEFKPITLLFGPNSAGKSTVVQALHYLREILEHNNCDPGHVGQEGSIDLGGFHNLVHKRNARQSIRLRADFAWNEQDLPSYVEVDSKYSRYEPDEDVHLLTQAQYWDVSLPENTAWVGMDISWSELKNTAYVAKYSTGINGDWLATCSCGPDFVRSEISEINFSHRAFRGFGNSFRAYLFTGSTDIAKEPMIAPIGFQSSRGAMPLWAEALCFWFEDVIWDGPTEPDQETQFNLLLSKQALSQGLVGPGEMLRDCLGRLLYLGPLREIPGRSYEPERSRSLSRWASGLGAWDVLHQRGHRFLHRVNDWLDRPDRLNAGYAVRRREFKEIETDGRLFRALREGMSLDDSLWAQEEIDRLPSQSQVTLRDEARGLDLLPQDVGVGISQVLPVIVAALHPVDGIVAIEQPELHIHPAFQVALGDLFISQISFEDKEVDIPKNLLFLIETHSEHLILRLLRRIRETHENELPPGAPSLTPGELAVYYVEPGDDGVSIKRLRVDETGEFIDRWPKGFFEERAEELF